MVILMLYLFGGPVLEGFSLTMLIGVSIGTASSIYVASALALKLGMSANTCCSRKWKKKGRISRQFCLNQVSADVENPGQKIGIFFDVR